MKITTIPSPSFKMVQRNDSSSCMTDLVQPLKL
jgi:hypothetical protein